MYIVNTSLILFEAHTRNTLGKHTLGRRYIRRSEQKKTDEVVLFCPGLGCGKEVVTPSAILTSIYCSFWLRI